MKKLLTIVLAVVLGWPVANAQPRRVKYGLFNHLGVAMSLGTDGIGFDLAAPITNFAALRAGVSFFPKLTHNDDIDINDNNPLIEPQVSLETKLNMFDFKVLADLYPFGRGSAFHLTAGLFFGNEAIATATNTNMFIKDPTKYGKLGLMLGDYRITTDKNGYISADVTVNKVKPYIGLGFGRAVQKKRIGVSCDFGVQFWGEPRLGANTRDDWGNESYHKFRSTDLDEYDDEDLRDALETAEKIKVYPVLNIRLTGRIF